MICELEIYIRYIFIISEPMINIGFIHSETPTIDLYYKVDSCGISELLLNKYKIQLGSQLKSITGM